MTGEIEAAGALATGGALAGAIDKGDPAAAAEGPCLNCGAQLAGGRYCGNCGQAAKPHRTLGHFIEEALHGVLHFDTKAWRTLPKLALRPGTLTREYIEGKRARYISPLALFLFTIFLMFAALAMTDGGLSFADIVHTEVDGADLSRQAEVEQALADLERERAAAMARGDIDEVATLDRSRAIIEASASRGSGLSSLGHAVAEAVRNGAIVIDTGNAELDTKIRDKLLNPDLLIYKIEQSIFKLAFLLIPISLPFIALLFLWRRGVTLYDHAVFALYSLSFMCLFFLALNFVGPLMGQSTPAQVVRSSLALFIPPVHMFFHLGGAYDLGLFSAIWRTLLLLVFCAVAFGIFFMLILAVSLLG